MATHSSVLAWRIPGTGEPGGLPSMGSHRVGHDWSDLAAVAAAYLGRCQGPWSVGREWGELVFNGDRVSVYGGEKIERWRMVRVAQQCECIWCHWTAELNMVKIVCFMLCDLYHNKKIKKYSLHRHIHTHKNPTHNNRNKNRINMNVHGWNQFLKQLSFIFKDTFWGC